MARPSDVFNITFRLFNVVRTVHDKRKRKTKSNKGK